MQLSFHKSLKCFIWRIEETLSFILNRWAVTCRHQKLVFLLKVSARGPIVNFFPGENRNPETRKLVMGTELLAKWLVLLRAGPEVLLREELKNKI